MSAKVEDETLIWYIREGATLSQKTGMYKRTDVLHFVGGHCVVGCEKCSYVGRNARQYFFYWPKERGQRWGDSSHEYLCPKCHMKRRWIERLAWESDDARKLINKAKETISHERRQNKPNQNNGSTSGVSC